MRQSCRKTPGLERVIPRSDAAVGDRSDDPTGVPDRQLSALPRGLRARSFGSTKLCSVGAAWESNPPTDGSYAVRLVEAGFASPLPPPATTVPAAPIIGSATFGDASATVRWTAPTTDGGSAITGYLIRVLDGTGAQVGALRPAGASATTLTVDGLTNGSPYRFQVAAANAIGTGPNSALSTLVIPATVPGAPAIGTAASGTAGGAVTATANWNPSASDGGSTVTGYVVRALRISATGTVLATTTSPVQPAAARRLTMTTLQAGNYRFTVQAANKAGSGLQSARSNLVAAQ